MSHLNIESVKKFVEENIGTFHGNRLLNLGSLKLNVILKRKNPYLFRAKNLLTAQDIVKGLLDAHLSSQEETIFGSFLEELAIFINAQVYRGKKSAADGIDLEFEKANVIYIVAIKSGPNWGNSQQINRMIDNFKKAKRILGTNTKKKQMIAVNGCCYGVEENYDKDDYLKLCGQRFWEFISGDKDLYIEIIEPLAYKAKEKNEEFLETYSKIVNQFTIEFGQKFCLKDGTIDWPKLVKFNSGMKQDTTSS